MQVAFFLVYFTYDVLNKLSMHVFSLSTIILHKKTWTPTMFRPNGAQPSTSNVNGISDSNVATIATFAGRGQTVGSTVQRLNVVSPILSSGNSDRAAVLAAAAERRVAADVLEREADEEKGQK